MLRRGLTLRLHSKYEHGQRQRWKKGCVVSDGHQGVLSRCTTPGSRGGRRARREVAQCWDLKRLRGVFGEYLVKGDMDTVSCVIQRVGEITRPGNGTAELLGEFLSMSKDFTWSPILASITLTAAYRCRIQTDVIKAVWRGIPGGVQQADSPLSSALTCARRDLTWARVLWSLVVGSETASRNMIVKQNYILSLSLHGCWGEVWDVGVPRESISSLMVISRKRREPDQGWKVWRWLLRSGVPPSCGEVTSLLEFLIVFGTERDLRWGFTYATRSSTHPQFTTDARFLLKQASITCYLHTTPTLPPPQHNSWLDLYKDCTVKLRNLPPHLSLIDWEVSLAKDLALKAAAMPFLSNEARMEYSNVIGKAIGRDRETAGGQTLERLERILCS